MNLEIRENGNDTLNTGQTQPEPTHLEERGGRDSFKNIDKPSFHDKFSFTSRSSSLEKQEGNDDDQVGFFNNTLEGVRSIIDGEESNGDEILVHRSNVSLVSSIESDPRIWKPPAPADIEDDMDSVANNDDDDEEYGDGTKWGQPSYLSGFDAENGKSLKEEREKAIMEAMNGQFKMLVNRFLASEDISNEGNPGERWLDIIASLSWEAALLIKPEANEGRAMDPGSYVKVKCIASGARTESQVVKGLVFKKNTAHKRMLTKFKNPRLLLLQGNLGQREVGLSSFDLMKEEENYLKAINDMLKACHPNVVLVEKSVSRDIQEFLLKEGMTLVFDMKLTRLNRISRCIGSPIISATDVPTNPKVKQCDSLYIEKFVEEHNNNEAAKKPNKTLMFLEGFPKPLGCTIILKGAPIDELKKVKRVVQYTVFAAYHLILETSFFADQRASFSDTHLEANGCLKDKSDTLDCCNDETDLNNSLIEGNLDGTVQPYTSNDPSFNGSLENTTHESMYPGSNFMYNQADLDYDKPNGSTVIEADALTRLEWMPSFSSSLKKFLSDSYTPINTDLFSSYFDFNMEELDTESVSGFPVTPSLEGYKQDTELNGHEDISSDEKPDPLSNSIISIENYTADKIDNESKDTIENVLEPQSILILRSSQCITKGVVCEQSHLYRIKYYGDFDVSLGRFLRDTLLKQKHTCTSCGEPPEAHVYCYTHQNGNLTVAVRQLPNALSLSGESEGKIWMWTRCLKCEHENGIPKSNPRVVMSRAARNFSFGKFLELSFSRHSVASRLSSKCGHSLHRDCLRFFGLGSKLAMFRYSSVEIYAPCKPPPVLELHNPTAQEWVKREAKSVLHKGDVFFLEVANLLEKFKRGDFGVLQKNPKNFMCRVKDLREVEEMLIQEKSEFEASLLKAINFSGQLGKSINDILSFSWLIEELLFELYIWDRRLHSLLQCIKDKDVSHDDTEEQPVEKTTDSPARDLQSSIQNPNRREESSIHISHAQNVANLESDMEARVADTSLNSEIADSSSSTRENETNLAEHVQSVAESESKAYDTNNVDSVNSKLDGLNDWVWAPFSELRRTYRKDLYDGLLHKFEYIRSFLPKYLSPIKLNPQENNSLHFPIGVDANVISLCEDEISSIIACALLLSEESTDEKDAVEGKGEDGKPVDNSNSLSSEAFVASYWLSTGSVEFEGIHPSQSLSSHSSGDLSTSETETSEILHPEILVASGKGSGRSRYSVVFIHAKQFYALRRMCCPSELAYISSLSRCKKWDAQGGKSKAFFAKTLDERFIIKQIKRTETESFLKFAPEYFRHISHSINSGSQTCLAKIFGIYQVRQNRGGKEVKIDLMVMENLLYGRNFTRTYDLKGALFSRYIDASVPETVLLDQNFVEDMRVSPMYIAGRNKHLFQRAIWNDTSFLTSINVMDYSLLVGVDKQRSELVFGIIDYVRQYTWDKQLETWVKSSLVVPRNSLPTVISPKEYKKRFRKFMSKYFFTVPATWTSEHCSGPCKFCNVGSTTSSSFEKTTLVSNT